MAADGAAPAVPGTLWVADRDGIAALDNTGEVRLEIATDRPVRRTAFDRVRDTVWVLDDRGELSAFDLEGTPLGTVEVPSPLQSPSSPPVGRDPELVMDSPAATLWLLVGNTLYRFDAQGDFQQALDLDPAERRQGLALDEARSRLWLANAMSLRAFAPSGANTRTIEVDLPAPGIEAIAFDPFLDALWVVGGGRVRRYDGEGQPVFEAEAGREIKHIAADGRDGTWLAGPERLEHIDPDAVTDLSVRLARDLKGGIEALTADPADGAVWVAGPKHLAQYGLDGTLQVVTEQARLTDLEMVRAPAVQVTILEPANGALINRNPPAVVLIVDGLSVAPERIVLTDFDVELQTNCEALAESKFLCQVNNELPQGENELIAAVTNAAGTRFASAPVIFGLDSIAPVITIDFPPEGHVAGDPVLELAGSVSEQAELVVNGEPVELAEDLTFRKTIELEEGDNLISLAARDPAGNLATAERTVVLSTAPSTGFAGRLLDANAAAQGETVPIVGAVVSFPDSGQGTTSDAGGLFLLRNLPAGEQVLAVDGQTANPAPDGSRYASFRGRFTLIENETNTLDRPIHLPRIDPAGVAVVDPLQTTVVENPEIGVSIEIPPNTAVAPDGSDFTGEMSISMVPPEFAPTQLSRELQPGLLFTIQPSGVVFREPVPVTFPNIDRLPPGSEVDLWALDGTGGEFTVVGRGRATADGTQLETILGGVRSSTWGSCLPAPPEADADNADNNDESDTPDEQAECGVGSSASLQGGCLRIRHQLPPWRSLDTARGLELAYSSSTAYPNPIINVETSLATTTATPVAFGIELLDVGGIDQNDHVFSEPLRTAQRHAIRFDARDFPTGRFPYQLMLDGHYEQSVVGTRITGNVLVNNRIDSTVGAGWKINGVSRLVDTTGDLLLETADGGLKRFDFLVSDDLFLPAKSVAFDKAFFAHFIVDADFNGDGILDLAVADSYSGGIDVLLGNSDGTFQQPLSVEGSSDDPLLVEDFNGDGIPDLAFADNFSAGNLGVLLGNGDGTFQPSFSLTMDIDIYPGGFVAADFNSDGVPDIAVAGDRLSNEILILLGNGDGNFQEPLLSLVTRESSRISIGVDDLDGDRLPDLAVVFQSSDDVSVLLGNGDGTFRSEQRFDVGRRPHSIVFDDFNADGIKDLATSNLVSHDVSVLLGDGNGTFQPASNFEVGDTPVDISTSDFNNDGVPDLVTTNLNSTDISVLFGNGNGTFQKQLRFDVGDDLYTGVYSMTVADLNGDDRPDVVTVNDSTLDIRILIQRRTSDTFAGPPGDFTTIERQPDGTFIRFFKDGSQTIFNADGLQTATIDTNGNITTFSYDSDQRLVSITDPVSQITQLRYSDGLLSGIEDPVGRITRFDHDAAGNLIKISNPDGTSRELAYDEHHLLTAQTDARGEVTQYTYDAVGRLLMSRLPDGSERAIAASRTQALAAGTTTVENPAPAVPADQIRSGFIDGEGRVQTFRTDRLGKITERTDPAGLVTTIDRDRNGNPLTSAFPDGSIISGRFDPRGNLLSLSDNLEGGTRRFEYEPVFNRVTAITDSRGNTTMLGYDARGNLTSLVTPESRSITFTSDARGLLSTSTDSLGTVRSFGYDATGNLTQLTEGEGEQQRVTAITNTPEGYVDTITDSEGHVTDFDYDTHGRLIRQTLPDGRVIRLAYDEAGNLIAVTPPERPEHRFSFNSVNLEAAYDPPDIGLPENTTRWEYNRAQQLTAIVRPDGKRIDFTYDDAGRLAGRDMPASSASLGYSAMIGQPISLETSDGIKMAFEWNGFLPTATIWNGPISGSVSRSFDADFRLAGEAVNGTAVAFGYDADGLLTQAGELSLNRDPASGLLAGTELGLVTGTIGYNSFAEPIQREVEFNGSPVLQFDYSRDRLGRITEFTETVGGSTETLAYRYDESGRLVEVRQNGMPGESYAFDANSNRIQRTTPAGITDYIYDDQDRLLEAAGPDGTTTYDYTAAGDLKSRTGPAGTTDYSYDSAGNLRNVTLPDGTEIEYLIDGLDRRIGKRINGTLVQGWLYRDQINPVAELDGQGNVVARFVYGDRPHVPAYMVKDGRTYRIVTDRLGSPRLVIDTETGEIAQRLDYDTFGNVITDTNPGFQPFGFAGGLYDPDTGLVRFGARDYDPETGRWTARDPIRFAGGDPNLYGYVLNDPINLTKNWEIPRLCRGDSRSLTF